MKLTHKQLLQIIQEEIDEQSIDTESVKTDSAIA